MFRLSVQFVMYRKLKYSVSNGGVVRKRWHQDPLTVFAIGVLIGVALAITVHHASDMSTVFDVV